MQGDQDVGGLEVAVDDPFLMGVLDGLADQDEQIKSLARREVGLIAVLGDGNALDEVHHEVGPACGKG